MSGDVIRIVSSLILAGIAIPFGVLVADRAAYLSVDIYRSWRRK